MRFPDCRLAVLQFTGSVRLTAAILVLFASTLMATNGYSQVPQESDGADFDEEGIAFFENQVKPILANSCLECHGNNPDSLGGELALISRKMILKGGDSGAAVDLESPGDSLLLEAVNYQSYEMPPSGKLPDDQIQTLARWIEMGMPWTPSEANMELEHETRTRPPEVNDETRSFWSFRNVEPVSVPDVNDSAWPVNEIDHFILARLEAAGLQPAPTASKQALVRRAYYDLLGLPPTQEQTDAFVNDNTDGAWSKLIDELLASPHYGEKWGRHWLDLVRYAESNSFERDGAKPFVWRYRDYVIRSFNDDKPYNQFLKEQLAGDELPNPSNDAIIATGYYRLGQWDDEPADRELARFDELDDILATTCQTTLGLTINCARCHDHKIDPVPTRDYYSMLAFFGNVRRYGVRGNESVIESSTRNLDRTDEAGPEQIQQHGKQIATLEKRIARLEKKIQSDFEPVEHEEFKYDQNRVRLAQNRVESGVITDKEFQRYVNLREQLKNLLDNPPSKFRVLCVTENEAEPEQMHIMIRGNPHVPGDAVEPGFVSVLSPPEPEFEPNPNTGLPARRLALANWIASKENPLTTRVIVNRIWQHHFGRGIVRTPSDFGFQGAPPTHQQLLDYLATRFVESGWSIKQMHRLIMNSRSYQMGNNYQSIAYEQDPHNNLFWRFDMRRLTAEEIRDSILAVSDRLNAETMFGPSIYPKLSREVLAGQSMPGAGWGDSTDPETRRRSIYIHIKRTLQVPLLANFDVADTDTSCPVRFNTTQPTQALGLLNSEFTNSEAREFAQFVSSRRDNPADQVAEILLRVTQRKPTDSEIAQGVKLMESWEKEDGVTREQALTWFCLACFNLNEFVFVE